MVFKISPKFPTGGVRLHATQAEVITLSPLDTDEAVVTRHLVLTFQRAPELETIYELRVRDSVGRDVWHDVDQGDDLLIELALRVAEWLSAEEK